jgi:galactose mutarotase-like enzyme
MPSASPPMPKTTLRLANDEFAVEISSLGAELQSVVSQGGTSWLWHGDPQYWAGRAPLMFPVVGHCRGGQIEIESKTYLMEPHGFARHSRFEVTESSATGCSMRLAASATTRQHFPFDFALEISFTLAGPTLTVEAIVRNLDTRPMPFTFGFHPGFAWPERGDGPANLVLGSGTEPDAVRLTSSGSLDPARLQLFKAGQASLTNTLLDAGTLAFEASSETMRLQLGRRHIDLALTNLPNLLVWTRHGASFLCLEPSHGMPALADGDHAMEARPYAVSLHAGQSASFAMAMTMSEF